MIRLASPLLAAGLLCAAAVLSAQTTQTRPTAPRKRPVGPRVESVRVSVRDDAGNPIPDTHLVLSGASSGEFTTRAAGTAILPDLKPGTYLIRAEHDGSVTLEREFTLGSGPWSPIELVLHSTPPPPKPVPAPVTAEAALPAGPPVSVAVPDFLERNYIGREPIKESVVACKPLETVRLLQLREPLAPHVHDRTDEIVYVVAGEGSVRIGDDVTALRPGGLVVVPHGSRHGFERRGTNPLILLSTLSGAACEAAR